jgi:hypothetical protein
MTELVKKVNNPIVLDPETKIVSKLTESQFKIAQENVFDLDFKNLEGVLDAGQWARGSLSASTSNDDLSITDAFYPEYQETAKKMFSEIKTAKKTRDHSLAAAIITSADYALLQDTVVIAENAEVIRVGILSQQFEEIPTRNLSGKWRDYAHDLKWFRNIPEGKSPEPSFGKVSETPFTVLKNGGAVAITDRARDVINGANIFQRLVGQLQQVRLVDENLMVTEEIESNTSNTEAGVDFGARSGTPPASTQNPLALINEINTDFGGTNREDIRWDLFVSRGFIYNEYITNDIVRNLYIQPIPSQTPQDLNSSSGVPGFPSYVTWVRDDTITNTTDAWALNRNAIKKFRGPTVQYTVTDPEKEYTKYTTKTHLAVETVKPELVYLITDVAA